MSAVKKRKLKKGLMLCLINVVIFILIIIFLIGKIIINYNKYKDTNNLKIGYYSDSVYVKYSGYLWKILKVNNDKSIEIIMDDNYNYMKWTNKDSNYLESDINKFLNNEFIKELDTNYLSKSIICNDIINDISKYSCDDIDVSYYVKLASYYDYVNTFDWDGTLWTSSFSKDGLYAISDKKVIVSANDDSYAIKPVVTLKSTVKFTNGDGSKEEPYKIDDKDDVINYYKIDNDEYISYKKDDNYIYLISLNKLVYRYNNTNEKLFNVKDETSLAYYLNNNIYNNLSYKDILVKFNINDGEYDSSYKDIYDNQEEIYIGIPTVMDKVVIDDSYYLVNSYNDKIYYMDNGLVMSNFNYYRGIRYTICISNKSVISGNGANDNPYIVEVNHE